MTVLEAYHGARHAEFVARLTRVIALRALAAGGMSQRQIARELDVSQPAISQQLTSAPGLDSAQPGLVVEAAAPVLRAVAAEHGYSRIAVGSVAQDRARRDSDIDLLVEPPEDTSSFDFLRFKRLIEEIIGREIDLVPYGGLTPGLDDDIQRQAVLL